MIAEVSGATLNFGMTAKARLYARSGVPEYWVLDVTGRRVIAHRDPVGDVYRSIPYGEDVRVATVGAPGREVRVGDLF